MATTEAQQVKVSRLERFIEYISPGWALNREKSRAWLMVARSNYAAAQKSRLRTRVPSNANAAMIDQPDRDLIRARARRLERDNDMANSVALAFLRNTVGTGIRPQPNVNIPNKKQAEKYNKDITKQWKKWVKAANCDIAGRIDFYGMQEMALRRMIFDGEILARRHWDAKASAAPIKLQIIEADALDSGILGRYEKSNGAEVVDGVEIDQYTKPLAYHIKTSKSLLNIPIETTRIPADTVIHLFKPTRSTAVRGISMLAPIINRIEDTDDYLEAELVAQRIAACFAVFVKTSQAAKRAAGRALTGTRELAEDGITHEETIAPGMISYLSEGESIETATPGRNSGTARDFVTIEQRQIAAGMGLSPETVSRDMSQATYSSSRANMLEDKRTYIPIQQFMITHFCIPIYEWFIDSLVANGTIPAAEYQKDPDAWLNASWYAPGWEWIDPLKDVKATETELKLGITTLQQVCAEKGIDWEENAEQRAKEVEKLQKFGILNTEGSKGGGGDGNTGGN